MTHIVTIAARCEDAHHRALRGGFRASLATAALLLATGCAAAGASDKGEPTLPGATPQQVLSHRRLAVASLLLADEVSPAPPGSMVDSTGPVTVTGDIGAPSRQVMTCTPLELPDGDDPGPAEPGAAGAASSSSVIGVAQVDQYAVVYIDEAAAQDAVSRARELAESCEESFAVHSPDGNAQATSTPVPGTVDGFQVHATYDASGAATTSDETSAVLRSGRVVLFLRAAETGSGPNSDQEVDGILDPEWTRQLISAAAANLAG